MNISTPMRIFPSILLWLISLGIFGQTVVISIEDSQNQPLPGATVQLILLPDSIKASAITTLNGEAIFPSVKQGIYLLQVRYMGYQPLEKNIRVQNEKERFAFKLTDDAIALGEVTVTARRPLIRQDGDRMIVDPEPLAGISTNTLEILEATPGLFVDPDGGIFISSMSPATVLINGREQKMSSQDINTLLRSLPPGSVQHIEVIRNPSARYAASGSGGIINIVLKRGMKIGRFGSVTTGMNQGRYGNRFMGVSFNNGGEKIASYINLSYNRNDMLEELQTTRVLDTQSILMQSAETRRQSHQAYLGLGASYDFSENLMLAWDGRVNGSLPQSVSNNTNRISNAGDELLSLSGNLLENQSDFLNLQQDITLLLRLDTLGSEWDTRFSYSYNYNDQQQNYHNEWTFPQAADFWGNGNNEQQRHFVQSQSDLTLRLARGLSLETGVLASWQEYDSDAAFFVQQGDDMSPDARRTQAFTYKENILSAYVQASQNLPWELLLKAGIRLEHTSMEGRQTLPADTSFVLSRSDWFPYVYLSRPLFAIAGYEFRSYLIYRKSITRPAYQNLNPHLQYIDQFLYETGNPSLTPQFTENMEANISMDDMPIFAVGHSRTRDIFSSVIYRDANHEDVLLRTWDNLGTNRETYFRAIAGIPPVNRYFFVAGAQYNLNRYDGLYEGEPLSFQRGSWRFFTFHAFRISPDTRLSLSGFLMTRGQMNFYELDTFGQLNISLNQTFFNKKLTITLSARDVLRTMQTGFTLNQGSISTFGERYTDNQRLGLNIRYTFGIPGRQERQNPLRFDMEE